jgi:Mycolic acid cyclopropane synthetase
MKLGVEEDAAFRKGITQQTVHRRHQLSLARSARFLMEDSRDIAGPFDRIVSVGMLEHVGVNFLGSSPPRGHSTPKTARPKASRR